MSNREVWFIIIGATVVVLCGVAAIYALLGIMMSTPAWWVGVFAGTVIVFVGIPVLVCAALLLFIACTAALAVLDRMR